MDDEEIIFVKLVKEGLPLEHSCVIDVKSKRGTICRVQCSEYECLYGNKFSSLLLEMAELINGKKHTIKKY